MILPCYFQAKLAYFLVIFRASDPSKFCKTTERPFKNQELLIPTHGHKINKKKSPKWFRISTPNEPKSSPKHDSETHQKSITKLIAKISNLGSKWGKFFGVNCFQNRP